MFQRWFALPKLQILSSLRNTAFLCRYKIVEKRMNKTCSYRFRNTSWERHSKSKQCQKYCNINMFLFNIITWKKLIFSVCKQNMSNMNKGSCTIKSNLSTFFVTYHLQNLNFLTYHNSFVQPVIIQFLNAYCYRTREYCAFESTDMFLCYWQMNSRSYW